MATDKASRLHQEPKRFCCFVVRMQLALLIRLFLCLHLRLQSSNCISVNSSTSSQGTNPSAHSMLLGLRALTEWKDLETGPVSSPEARRVLHTSPTGSAFDVGALTHVPPPPDLFTWPYGCSCILGLFSLPSKDRVSVAGGSLACAAVSRRAAQKRGRRRPCSPIRMDCWLPSLAPPSVSPFLSCNGARRRRNCPF